MEFSMAKTVGWWQLQPPEPGEKQKSMDLSKTKRFVGLTFSLIFSFFSVRACVEIMGSEYLEAVCVQEKGRVAETWVYRL